ncbi:hypothetical protein EV651_107139 [Kribbella sp. VKM Ac-2571]|nr:hypothetical protein EV651_107139 [Kribbella sp. VKM Ac-2571]
MGYGEWGAVVKSPTSDADSTKEHLIDLAAAQTVARAEHSEMTRLFGSFAAGAKSRLRSRFTAANSAR